MMNKNKDAMKEMVPITTAEFNFKSKYLDIEGRKIHYIEEGQGEAVLFIHGCPTSSYLWRNIIPFAASSHRAIAFDLIGMGKSDKPEEPVNFQQNLVILKQLISLLNLKNITLVLHDWGAALGFEYARTHPDIVKSICFIEGVLPPTFPQASFDDMGEDVGELFRAFKDPVLGYDMIVKENFFIEKTLPNFINRSLDKVTWAHYREPFLKEEHRSALLTWPRELPIEGEPSRNVKLMADIEQFMKSTTMPMLLLYCEPGTLITYESVCWYQANIINLKTQYVGQGTHFIQEDEPINIGQSLSNWLDNL